MIKLSLENLEIKKNIFVLKLKSLTYFSKKIPVRIAFATDLNFGFSLLGCKFCLVNVAASHLRTSSGTVSGVTSDKSSSSSHIRLF